MSVNGYAFTAVLQFSNAGGGYRANAPDGRPVLVKEARGDNGYQWDGAPAAPRLRREHATLREIHAARPGRCPEPLDYFPHWEHEFLVTELVPGVSLVNWVSQHNPAARTGATAADFRAYYDRCRTLLSELRAQIDDLHAIGYDFGDLNPRNVLVDEQDHPRLVALFSDAIPERAMGRVNATLMVLTTLATMIGALTAGTLADLVSVRGAVWTCAITGVAALPILRPLWRPTDPQR